MEEKGILTRLKDRLGANGPGMTIAIIALMVALTGGAYAAAKGGLTGKQKKQVEKIAKKFAGEPGAVGPAGPQGPAGVGVKGETGAAGKEGKEGKSGTSATALPYSGPECEEGGIEVKSASPTTFVCNGEEGAKGTEGSPWTANGKLPPGAIETGTWGVQGTGSEVGAPISFTIPLKKEIETSHIHYTGETGFESLCGTLFGPNVKPGELCVYRGSASGATLTEIVKPNFETPGAAPSGAILVFNMPSGGNAYGAYAVEGCTEETGKPTTCP